jgi:hypothetical protein
VAKWRTTRSGYRYESLSAREEITRQGADGWERVCPEEDCGLLVQGGKAAMTEHYRTVHRTEGQDERSDT